MKKTLSFEHDAAPLVGGKSGNGRFSLLSPTVLVAFKETLTQQHTVIVKKLKTFENGMVVARMVLLTILLNH